MAILFGGLTLIDNHQVSQRIGQHILNLKVAGEVLMNKAIPVPRRKTIPTMTTTAPAQEVKPGEQPEVAPALSGTAIADIKNTYKSELRSRIEENKFYPVAARRLGQTGVVIVAFTLLADGSIINVRIDSSSGNTRLDSAGVEAVKKVGKFKAIPSELQTSSMDMSVQIKFQTL
jgi:protein TonB